MNNIFCSSFKNLELCLLDDGSRDFLLVLSSVDKLFARTDPLKILEVVG